MNQLSENVKALFFAQYLGQDVFMTDNYIKPTELTVVHLAGIRGYLLLRKVEQLTDEERLIIGRLMGLEGNLSIDKEQPQNVICDKDNSSVTLHGDLSDCGIWNGEEYDSNWSADLSFEVCQYMARIGILLPYTYLQDGKPQTLTVEQIVEMGWVRIKE